MSAAATSTEMKPLVIDNGSGFTKAGFAGDEAPKSIFPTIVGRPRYSNFTFPGTKEWFGGDEAARKRGILTLKYPIEFGIITNWEAMEQVWYYTFYDALQVEPEQHAVLLTDSPRNPKKNREKMTEVMFETFVVPELYIEMQPSLALRASSLTTGVLLDSGDAVTHAVPFHNEIPIHGAIEHRDFGGRDLTTYFMKLVVEGGTYYALTNATRDIARQMKEKMSYAAADYQQELVKATTDPSSIEKTFEPVDMPPLTLTKERFMVPEAMFNPELMQLECSGIAQIVYNSIQKCPEHIREDLFANIILSGGNTCFSEMAERLHKELSSLGPTASFDVNIIAPENRQCSAWIGGSKFASQIEFQQMCISKQEYSESGAAIVHRKCGRMQDSK